MKFGIFFLLAIFGISTHSYAQSEGVEGQTDRAGPPKFWEATLPGGSFLVALDRITSISRHTYVLDGSVIVDEVTVDTVGQALARFYHITPVTADGPGAAANLVEQGVDQVTGLAEGKVTTVQNMVMKKYPVTTHAKSIEYRILSVEQLNDLFESAEKAWKDGKGRVFSAN